MRKENPEREFTDEQEDPLFDRPVFILSPPRSGSTLLFETLSQASSIFTIGSESHGIIEKVEGLSPRDKGYESNMLGASDAGPVQVRELRERFYSALHDRSGCAPMPGKVRMLEKTPKNALRVDFIKTVFPGARFIFLYRDPKETIGSMIDAWRSQHFRTYLDLPGWPYASWSLLLVPGWRDLARRPLHEIVCAQWQITMNCLLDSLESMSSQRWCAVDYASLIREPDFEIRKISNFHGIEWDRKVSGVLPLSRNTLTVPAPGKWHKHASLIEPMLPLLAPTIERARLALKAGLVS